MTVQVSFQSIAALQWLATLGQCGGMHARTFRQVFVATESCNLHLGVEYTISYHERCARTRRQNWQGQEQRSESLLQQGEDWHASRLHTGEVGHETQPVGCKGSGRMSSIPITSWKRTSSSIQSDCVCLQSVHCTTMKCCVDFCPSGMLPSLRIRPWLQQRSVAARQQWRPCSGRASFSSRAKTCSPSAAGKARC